MTSIKGDDMNARRSLHVKLAGLVAALAVAAVAAPQAGAYIPDPDHHRSGACCATADPGSLLTASTTDLQPAAGAEVGPHHTLPFVSTGVGPHHTRPFVAVARPAGATHTAPSVPTLAPEAGFDWTAAGVGAVMGLGAALLVLLGVATIRRRPLARV